MRCDIVRRVWPPLRRELQKYRHRPRRQAITDLVSMLHYNWGRCNLDYPTTLPPSTFAHCVHFLIEQHSFRPPLGASRRILTRKILISKLLYTSAISNSVWTTKMTSREEVSPMANKKGAKLIEQRLQNSEAEVARIEEHRGIFYDIGAFTSWSGSTATSHSTKLGRYVTTYHTSLGHRTPCTLHTDRVCSIPNKQAVV